MRARRVVMITVTITLRRPMSSVHRDLSFLTNFRHLSTLILDQNTAIAEHTLPVLPALRILWLNNCAIEQPTAWLRRLQVAAPQLRQLSLLGNPGCRSLFNGSTPVEACAYRRQVVAFLPGLQHLDDAPVKDVELKEAVALQQQRRAILHSRDRVTTSLMISVSSAKRRPPQPSAAVISTTSDSSH